MTSKECETELKDKELLYIDSVKKGNFPETKQLISQVAVDCCEKNGMTALMHASYKGNTEMVEYLLANAADPNLSTHTDQYTPLMFAALSGSTETCRLLLEAGAKPDVINAVKRTAAQLGAFVGRHDCVSVINNFVQLDQIKYHTKKHGLEEAPKLKVELTEAVHKLIILPNLNPIKNEELLFNQKAVSTVLEFECQKAYHEVNEILAIKVHLFNCVLKKCKAWYDQTEGNGGIKGLLKHLVKGQEKDGFQMGIETMIREAVKSFPYAKSNVFQQIVRVLAPVTPGEEPTALAVLTQYVNGVQSADFSECCACCGTRHSVNKCSNCKMVRYCNSVCQRLHWSNHKIHCKQLKKQYNKIQAEEKRLQEEEKLRKEIEDKVNLDSVNHTETDEMNDSERTSGDNVDDRDNDETLEHI